MGNIDQSTPVIRPEALAARQGRAFMAGSSALVVAAASSIRCTLENPAGSNTNLILTSARGFTSTGGALYGRIWLNPTANLPSTIKAPMNLLLGNTAAANGIMKTDAAVLLSSGLSGGTDTGIDLVITNSVQEYTDPIIIPPGQKLGLNVPVPLALIGTVVLDLRWIESGLAG